MKTPTEFTVKVIQFIKAIPYGKVATYGQIAALAGKPHGARGVSWILHSSARIHKLPWYRVLGSSGTISIPRADRGYLRQKRLLKSEGVVFEGERIDLKKYGWSKKPRAVKKNRLTPRMFS